MRNRIKKFQEDSLSAKKIFDKSVIGNNLMMTLYFSCWLECTELLTDILVWRHFSKSDAFRFFHTYCFQLVCDKDKRIKAVRSYDVQESVSASSEAPDIMFIFFVAD